jgi:hypothetical protein
MVFIERWTLESEFLVSLGKNHLSKWKTYPIFSLGSSLCKKLNHLDPYTSSVIYSSFWDMRDMFEGTFRSALKDNMIKLDEDARKKLLEKSKKTNPLLD